MTIGRREFLKLGILASAYGLGQLGRRSAGRAFAIGSDVPAARCIGGYGPLVPTPEEDTGELAFAMPTGFKYRIFGRVGDPLADGRLTPPAHDGMASFLVDGKIRIVRNHEVSPRGVCVAAPAHSFDPSAAGGTTTLVIDPTLRRLERAWISLSGTTKNCAGGPTPWGAWISCEESTDGVARFTDATGAEHGGFEREHGYCFEVPARADDVRRAEPIRAMGRFVHEAIAIDPATGIVYETEDWPTAGLYRFIPRQPQDLHAGGQLEMLAVTDHPGFDARTGQVAGVVRNCHWVPIADPDPVPAELRPQAVYEQGKALGAATFSRLEGCWYGDGSIFVTATDGGDAKLGQVWRYTPRGADHGELTLVFESRSAAVLQNPDNLCVSPRRALVLCEDCLNVQYMRGLTATGEIFDLVRNLKFNTEFCGVNFSPDGETLFFNLQTPGMTVAMWGDWRRGVL
ncbi:MAG: alkaline phosphatase PhoX [Planctomycetota bacterium]